jgi:hypothetical protein
MEGILRYAVTSILAVFLLIGSETAGHAQETPSRLAIDVSGGKSAFVDETPIGQMTIGGGVRWQLTPRVSVGPEVVLMKGPNDLREVFLTGKAIVDFMPHRLLSPYFVADAGAMLQGDRFANGPYWSKEGAVSAGGGVRINVTPHVSIAPEVRIGWEPHVRFGAVVTWRP